MPLRQSMQRLAADELLRYLSFECGAVGTVLSHGFHPLKARHRWSIPNPSPVHPEGRTPAQGQTIHGYFHGVPPNSLGVACAPELAGSKHGIKWRARLVSELGHTPA